jgi:hypothetical protein
MLKVNRMGAKSEEMKEAKQWALLIHVERRSGWLSFFMDNSYGKMFLCFIPKTNKPH